MSNGSWTGSKTKVGLCANIKRRRFSNPIQFLSGTKDGGKWHKCKKKSDNSKMGRQMDFYLFRGSNSHNRRFDKHNYLHTFFFLYYLYTW